MVNCRMADTPDNQQNADMRRLIMAAIGAAGGLSLWWLLDYLPDQDTNPRLILIASAFAGSFFFGLLATLGPLAPRAAVLTALASSVVPALLLGWSSQRFETVEGFLESGHPMVAWFVTVTVPIPFFMSIWQADRGWQDYKLLFGNAWNIVVRFAVAWVFVGVFWGVILLSDALLNIAGIEWIETILDIDPVPLVLTGAALGLALAVVFELAAYISPFLVLRLLRLLLPVVTVVVAIFVVAAPVRGLSELFGELSAAGVLMGMAIGAITLITTALDQDDAAAVKGAMMQRLTRLLALLLPILAVLSAYAIWVRVAQYGWSPERLAAATVSVFVLAYALIYGIIILLGRGWMDRMRSANIAMAGLLVAVGILWLTPIINPQRIAANSQLARYVAEKLTAEELDLWAMGREWGRAGKGIVGKLAEIRPDMADVVNQRVAALNEAVSRWDFVRDDQVPRQASLEQFIERLAIYPPGSRIPEFAEGADVGAKELLKFCDRTTPGGHIGCAGIAADIDLTTAGNELILALLNADGTVHFRVLLQNESGELSYWRNMFLTDLNTPGLPHRIGQLRGEKIDDIANGDFTIGPPRMNALQIGEIELIPTLY